MTQQQKQEFLQFINRILNENINNKITPAMGIGLFNQLNFALEDILGREQEQAIPNDAMKNSSPKREKQNVNNTV